jgi:hypothetical protein
LANNASGHFIAVCWLVGKQRNSRSQPSPVPKRLPSRLEGESTMRKIQLAVIGILIPLCSACTAAFAPATMNTVSLNDLNFAEVENMRRGEACATTILGLFTDGEAMVTTAARNGRISRVEVVEHKVSGNPLFSRQCVIVFGR